MSDVRQETAPVPPLLRPGIRARDHAESMGQREVELLAAHDGQEVVRLSDDMRGLIEALPDLGEIMSLTRNDAAVHEKVGRFGNITLGAAHGLVLNRDIDLRLFLAHWKYAFAAELPGEAAPRRSLQIFDGFGDAVLKVHLRSGSNVEAFASMRRRLAADDPAPVAVLPQVLAPLAKPDVDAEAFRRDFDRMRDVHEFFPLLARHSLTRRGALDVIEGRYRRRLACDASLTMLEAAAASALPIMCFVGSRGCIQIHAGPVVSVKQLGPWLNILDPGFNLHLREDLVTEVWSVKKPTAHGPVTSVELYDGAGGLIAQFFGVREPSSPENPAWSALVDGLNAGAD